MAATTRQLSFLAVLMGVLFFLGACASTKESGDMSLQRKNTEVSDPKWTSFQNVQESFKSIQQSINEKQTVTVEDLEYFGFGPKSNNASKVIYTALQDLFIGTKGDRSRLPKDVEECVEKKGDCYGLVVQLSSLNKEGEEGWFERIIANKKKTRVTGWQFSGVFAIEKRGKEEIVVAAYANKEEANIFKLEDGSDPRERIINTLNIGTIFSGF